MSNIVPSNLQVPAHIAARMGKSLLADNIAGGLQTGGVPRISLKGSRFRIVEDGVETVLDATSIDVVIVGANPRISKTWYEKAWTPDDEPSAPDCFSMDGIGPDASSSNPQNDLCATCPQNVWGSKITPAGQQIKACSDTKRLAVLPADDVEEGKVYLLQVTPSVLKDLAHYQKQLTMRGYPPETIRTKLSFDTDASFPKLKFAFGGFLDEAQIVAVEARIGSDEALEVTGEKVVAAPAPAPKPVAKASPVKQVAKPVAKKAPAPVEEVEEVEAEEVEEAPKPAAKKGFGAGSIASKVAAVEAEAAPAKKGFGGAAKAATPATKPKVAAKPAPAAKEASDDDLANEIADLMAGLADDEAE